LIKNAYIADNTNNRKSSVLSSNNVDYEEEVTTEELAKKEFKNTLKDY